MNAVLKIISHKLEEYVNEQQLTVNAEPDWLQYFTRKLAVKEGNLLRIIPLTDVLYLQSHSNYTLIVTESNKYLVSKTMKHFEKNVLHTYFLRVHKSFTINKMWVESLSKSEQCLYMTNGIRIPISKNCKSLTEKVTLSYQKKTIFNKPEHTPIQ